MKILIVEDDSLLRLLLKRLIKRQFSNITVFDECYSAEQALEYIPYFNPDLLIVDISLPGMDGIELIRNIKKIHPIKRIVVITGYEKELHAQLSMEAGADHFFSKTEYDRMLDEMAAWKEFTNKFYPVIDGNGSQKGEYFRNGRYLQKPDYKSKRRDENSIER
jgi:YesN/AraC family two-component response regulator